MWCAEGELGCELYIYICIALLVSWLCDVLKASWAVNYIYAQHCWCHGCVMYCVSRAVLSTCMHSLAGVMVVWTTVCMCAGEQLGLALQREHDLQVQREELQVCVCVRL